MASNQKQNGPKGGQSSTAQHRRAPEWADGLKQLYDSVVEEDLPDSFKDLLDKLDGIGGAKTPGGSSGGSPSPSGQ